MAEAVMSMEIIHRELPGRHKRQAATVAGFLRAVRKETTQDSRSKSFYQAGDPDRTDLVHVSKTALNTGSGLQGGYLVPESLRLEIFRSLDEESFIRPRALAVPVGTLESSWPTMDMTKGAADVAPWFGGMQFIWGTGASYTSPSVNESEPQTRSVKLKLNDLVGQLVISNQLLQDITPQGEQLLFQIIARGAAWTEEYAFLRGTGASTKQPLGVINSPACKTVTRAVGNQIAQADIAGMAATMYPRGWMKGIWACNPSALVQIVKLTAFIPNQVAPVIDDGRDYACAGTLLTRPLFVTDKLPVLGGTGDLIFFDPSIYLIADKEEMAIDVSPHPLWTTNQSVIRVWLRVDGRPWPDTTFKLPDNATSVAGFVALQ